MTGLLFLFSFSLGRVDEFGIYESFIGVQLEVIAAYERKGFRSRVSRAVKRFVLGSDEDKDKEEMAFRIAKMIVTNILQQQAAERQSVRELSPG